MQTIAATSFSLGLAAAGSLKPKVNELPRPAAASRAGAARSLTVCSAARQGETVNAAGFSRREACLGAAASLALLLGNPLPSNALPTVQSTVGEYLPSSGVGDFVVFEIPATGTPSLRAGTIPNPYSFYLPPSWKQQPVANAISGNYCQPKCDEPWTEVKFSDPVMGDLTIIATSLKKVTPKRNVNISEITTLEGALERFGANITGDVGVEPDEVESKSQRTDKKGQVRACFQNSHKEGPGHAWLIDQGTARGFAFGINIVASQPPCRRSHRSRCGWSQRTYKEGLVGA
eukprot:jgi/Mesvir1/26431/Mv16119-RA.1